MSTDYKEGDLIDEGALRAALASARTRLDLAQAETEAARNAWNEADKALSKGLGGRWPKEGELTYALGATCKGCNAPLAYWSDIRATAWDCADVLLGRVGTPEDKALVVERSMFSGPIPDPPEGKVLHDRLPFAFWKVKSDPTRKTRDLPASPQHSNATEGHEP